MNARIAISAAVAAAAVALSACAGTSMLPEYDDAAPVPTTTTTTDTTTTTTALPTHAPATSAHVAKPAALWLPTASMSIDQVMREASEDATAFWSTASRLPQYPAIPGDTTCGGDVPVGWAPAALCSGEGVRWDTRDLQRRYLSEVPALLQPWTLTIVAAHEVGHLAINSWSTRSMTDQQHEDVAECLAGAYFMHRFNGHLTGGDIADAYWGLGRQYKRGGAANSDAFFEGLRIPTAVEPRDAYKTCMRSWG